MSIFSRVKQDHTTRKNFKYEKEGIALSFTLRVDVKNELKNFEDLLIVALEDVREELKK